MPRQRRIDDETFKRALYSLSIDQIISLNDCQTSADVWGQLCMKMGKANNQENRRACFDLWRRKQYKCEEIINNIPQVFLLN